MFKMSKSTAHLEAQFVSEEGAKYAEDKYLPPPIKMHGVTFHLFLQHRSKFRTYWIHISIRLC